MKKPGLCLFSYIYIMRFSSATYAKLISLLIGVAVLVNYPTYSQSYFSTGSHILYKIEIDDSQCGECSFNFVAPTTDYPQGISFGPDTNLYYESSPDLKIMDTITGNSTLYFTAPGMPPNFCGLVSVGGGIFYSMDSQDEFLWKYDVNAGMLSMIGPTGYSAFGDLTMYNGDIYYTMQGGIIKLDVNIPSNSSLVVSMPGDYLISGITASHVCNSLLALLYIESEDTYELV